MSRRYRQRRGAGSLAALAALKLLEAGVVVVGPVVLLAAALAAMPGSTESTGEILASWLHVWF